MLTVQYHMIKTVFARAVEHNKKLKKRNEPDAFTLLTPQFVSTWLVQVHPPPP